VREEIARQTNGYDMETKAIVTRILNVGHAIRSIGGYDFEDKLEDKLMFVRAMSDPVFDVFSEEYRSAKLKQSEMIKEKLEELKKTSPDQS